MVILRKAQLVSLMQLQILTKPHFSVVVPPTFAASAWQSALTLQHDVISDNNALCILFLHSVSAFCIVHWVSDGLCC